MAEQFPTSSTKVRVNWPERQAAQTLTPVLEKARRTLNGEHTEPNLCTAMRKVGAAVK